MALRGNALLRRIRRHRSMTTLYRSSQFEAPAAAIIPERPLASLGAATGAQPVVAQLMPAHSNLPYGQLIPAEGARFSAFARPQPAPPAAPQQLSEQYLETPPISPETSRAPGIVPSSPQTRAPTVPEAETARPSATTPPPAKQASPPPAPAVQREPTQPRTTQQRRPQPTRPQPVRTPPPGATTDFSWISDSEWDGLKRFAEGHQKHLARQESAPEAIQRAEQEKADQAAREQREAEIARRQELARQGKLPKADISYLSTQTAGMTPQPTVLPTAPLQRSADEAGQQQTSPTPEEPPSTNAEGQAPALSHEPDPPVVTSAAQEPTAPLQAKATGEVKTTSTPPAAPSEKTRKPASTTTAAEQLPRTGEPKPDEQVEMPEEFQAPIEHADQDEPAPAPTISEEQPEHEAGGIRRFLDAARSFLRRDEGESPESTIADPIKPAAVQRHEAEEPDEPSPVETIETAPLSTTPAVQREIADVVGMAPPDTLAAPEEQPEPGQPTAAVIQESPVMDTPAPEVPPATVRPAAPEVAPEISPPPPAMPPETPVKQAPSTPAAVQRTVEEPRGQEIATPPAPQAATPAAAQPTVEEPPGQEVATPVPPPAESPAVPSEGQIVTARTSQPPAPTGGVEGSTSAPPTAGVPTTSSTPSIQRETVEPAEIAEPTEITPPPESSYETDAGDAETLIQPVPLEAAWPVQQVETPKLTGTPRVTKKPAGPVAQRKPAGIDQAGEHIHETIKDIAPVEATDSSIELITPRRPRPTFPPKVEAATAGIQREEEPTQRDEPVAISDEAQQPDATPPAPELPTAARPSAAEIQRQEQLPAAPPGDRHEPVVISRPADEQAAEISSAARQPEPAEDAIDRQPDVTIERPLTASEPVLADISPVESPAKAPAVQLSPDASAPQSPAQVPGPEPESRKETTEPYPVPTPIGDLPSDLWEMLGEKPPARQPATQAQDARTQPIQRQADAQPQQLITEVFRTPDLQREEATAGRTETAGTATTEEAVGEGEEEKKSEVDLDELARKVYPQIKRRLEVEWERGRGRF